MIQQGAMLLARQAHKVPAERLLELLKGHLNDKECIEYTKGLAFINHGLYRKYGNDKPTLRVIEGGQTPRPAS